MVCVSTCGTLVWTGEACLCGETCPGCRVCMSMRGFLDACKPGASARVHLLLAAGARTAAGVMLVVLGVRHVWPGRVVYVVPLLVFSVAVGILKGRFALRPSVSRSIERIRTRGDGHCVGGFFSVRMWALIGLMMVAGHILRGGLVPRGIIGFLYTAVGIALLLTAPRLWLAWHQQKRAA